MPKRRLTPEQKKEKNKRSREAYAAARALGLSPKQAKAFNKTVKENPDIVKDVPKEIAESLIKTFSGLTDFLLNNITSISETLTGQGVSATNNKKRKINKTKNENKSSGKSSGKSNKSKKKKAPIKGVALKPEQRKDTSDFAEFVTYYPNANATQVIKFYREETGKTISNDKAYRIIREVRTSDKQYEKVRFKIYGTEDNPSKKKYLMQRGRFIYAVRYDVIVDGAAAPFDQYIHITSSRELTPSQIVTKTLESFQIGQEFGKERYIAKRIDPNSIHILYGVDTWKKTVS